ncbi:MAG: hypothetical protein EA359_07965 [Balneolaceae bacterium]|jgi:hypothetical protein|nr:MAG: hypothetical protein EA359_07965 [Balneolaceae bacterium]
MDPQEIAIVAIVFGSVVTIVFLGIVGSIIKAWVKRGSGKNITENQEFLSALREFKEKTDRRLANLEAIVTDDKPENAMSRSAATKKDSPRLEQKSSIEIEIENEGKKEATNQGSKLRNMLNQ